MRKQATFPFTWTAAVSGLTLLFLAPPALAISYEASVLADDPTAYWRLDEAEAPMVFNRSSSGAAFDGAYVFTQPSGASRYHSPFGHPSAFAGLGKAAFFQRNSNSVMAAEIPNSAVTGSPLDPDGEQSFTIEAWINLFTERCLSWQCSIVTLESFEDWASGNFVNGFRFRAFDGDLFFSRSGASAAARTTDQPLAEGAWHHVAVVVEQGGGTATATFYVDGDAASEPQVIAPMRAGSSGPLRIGLTDPQLINYAFHGLIDEVAFYPTALSADRLRAHYDAAVASGDLDTSVGRGRRLMMEKGLQLQTWMHGQASGIDGTTFQNFGATASSRFYEDLWVSHPEIQWAHLHFDPSLEVRTRADGSTYRLPPPAPTDPSQSMLSETQTEYYELEPERFTTIQLWDEQSVINEDPDTLARTAAWAAHSRERHPDLLVSNNLTFGAHHNLDMLQYLQTAQPDLLTYTMYIVGDFSYAGASAKPMYQWLGRLRHLASRGVDDTGSAPIPFGTYLRTFQLAASEPLSESEIRLSETLNWAFGSTWVGLFTYGGGMLFNSLPDQGPTPSYGHYATAHQWARNLGPSLVRLASRGVRVVPGQHLNSDGVVVNNSLPTSYEVLRFDPAVDPSIDAIQVIDHSGAVNDGLRGDVIFSWFEVLSEELDGLAEDERYFMIANGLHTGPNDYDGGSAASTWQQIEIVFDFAGSGVTGLQRLRRDDGTVERVGLEPLGDDRYRLVLDLDGGTGDLFKLDTGACFVGVEACDVPTVCAEGCAFTAIQPAIDAASPGDLITVAPGVYTGALTISKTVAIEGFGQAVIDAGGAARAVTVGGGAEVTLRAITVRGADGEAGIANYGTMTLERARVTANAGTFGGIFNVGALTVADHSEVDANTGLSGFGGGITNFETLIVVDSTVRGNQGYLGGGIHNSWGTVLIDNSDLSGNHATSLGGGYSNHNIGGTVTEVDGVLLENTTGSGQSQSCYDVNPGLC